MTVVGCESAELRTPVSVGPRARVRVSHQTCRKRQERAVRMHATPHAAHKRCAPPLARGRRQASTRRFYAGYVASLSNTSRLTTLSESVCRGRAVARTTGRERHRVNWSDSVNPSASFSATAKYTHETSNTCTCTCCCNKENGRIPGSLKIWPDALQVSCQQHSGISVSTRLASRQRLG